MKVIHFFAITAMAAAMFTSCSNDGDLAQSNYPSDSCRREQWFTHGKRLPHDYRE